ncbi:MAG: hypothetical protein UW68_C0016G0026 [Candidatus Collierbacteria bacterium GW2011_GWB1_44_6]|uniref:Uncharacterized protein n=2 Tax=Candidatus Collieribacteriota TaxID=1752725 RepID=A0A0G1JNP7_9BACT|nr:MAG: hypothetical protein UV68_C0017G0007 [Candidatus Collierbacteria bacterium GW2011_GWC2_43_12]KKT73146.1 MAG: hypothetical protein UW68_C0016G0026 [Candidatus Collierbacteria bacterium GW2011_GWB1_44_6]KKT81113.1 MAG: hypothetical protein UW80_C0058G0001 [Microgenomates group bacterium GW2011_GWC1_44_9]
MKRFFVGLLILICLGMLIGCAPVAQEEVLPAAEYVREIPNPVGYVYVYSDHYETTGEVHVDSWQNGYPVASYIGALQESEKYLRCDVDSELSTSTVKVYRCSR